jgi:hypothetical protein
MKQISNADVRITYRHMQIVKSLVIDNNICSN